MNDNALDIQNLVKKYNDKTAVNNISLTIKRGEFFGFLGPNGAGKSTTINAITGISKITSGTIKIFGVDVEKEYREARKLVGLSPQEFNVDIFAKVKDILYIVGGYYGIPKKERLLRVDELIERFHLAKYADMRFKQLSGGYKRRVVLARALIHRPELLILDEPTSGVDVELRHELWDHLKELNKQGTTILLTSHYLEEVEMLCEKIAIISDGHIIKQGTKTELIGEGQTLEDVYLEVIKK